MNSNDLMKYWLEKIVIGLDLCPFARKPYEEGSVRIIECLKLLPHEHFDFFRQELSLIYESSEDKISTTIIYFPKYSVDFETFNDFVGACEELISDCELEDTFQLVVFHPDFIFENTSYDQIDNYIGRSPFPVIHVLRQSEIEAVVKKLSDGENISKKNTQKFLKIEKSELDKLFFYLSKN